MLYVTDEAVLALAHELDVRRIPHDRAFRIHHDAPSRFRLEVDARREDDDVASTEQRVVLFVPAEVQTSADGYVLDIIPGTADSRLGVRESAAASGWAEVALPKTDEEPG